MAALGLVPALPAWGADAAAAAASPWMACDAAIAATERDAGLAIGLPGGLLGAIGRVESGRRDPQGGGQHPWPWSINVAGAGLVFDTKEAAVEAVRGLLSAGPRSIDVGCMQVNLLYHPNAFASLEDAFDPPVNVRYAAGFLDALHRRLGDWDAATGAYHSGTPDLALAYRQRVAASLGGGLWSAAAARVGGGSAGAGGGLRGLPAVLTAGAGDPYVVMRSARAAGVPVYVPAAFGSGAVSPWHIPVFTPSGRKTIR